MGHYEIKIATNDQYYFNLKAGNGEIILTSETYVAKSGAKNGIRSCQVNSPFDSRYSRLTASSGQAYFVLKAANGEIIGNSQMYSSKEAREKGIESVKLNGPTDDIRE